MSENRFSKFPKTTMSLVVLSLISIILLTTELFLHIFSTNRNDVSNIERYINLREYRPNSVYHLIPDDRQLKFTDGLDKAVFRMEIDENGFIAPSVIDTNSDATIVFLGGSTTECGFVHEDQRFPYLVKKLLEKKGHSVNTINSGRSGNHSLHSINLLLNKILKHNPDYAVMMHNINDFSLLMHYFDYWQDGHGGSLIKAKNKRNTFLKDSIKKLFPNLTGKLSILRAEFATNGLDEFASQRRVDNSTNSERIYSAFSQNMHLFVDIALNRGITPVLMTQANRINPEPLGLELLIPKIEKAFGIPFSNYQKMYAEMNQIVRDVAIDRNVALIDLARAVPSSSEYMYDLVHFNDNGSRFVAKHIAEKLDTILNRREISSR